MINGDIPVTQTTSAVDVTSDMKYGVIPSTVHFLYESIKTDSICVAHVTIYLSTKKGKRVTMKTLNLKHLSKTGNKNQTTLTEFSYSLSCTVARRRYAKIKKKSSLQKQ